MKLYTYFRSSASYRVRIALNLKGVSAEMIPVNLLKAEQREEAYGKINPQQLLPSLILDSGETLIQSLAIMEYLEEAYPQPPLLPVDPVERARVRALALAVACDMAPLNNLGAIHFLEHECKMDSHHRTRWINHWMHKGFKAIETLLASSPHTGKFCHGDTPGLADCCLIPQVYNAHRRSVDMSLYPMISSIDAECAKHPAFMAAHPDKQPDALPH